MESAIFGIGYFWQPAIYSFGSLPNIIGVNIAVFASLISEEPAVLCVGAVDQDLVAVLPAVTVDDFAVGGLAHGQAGSAVIVYDAVYVTDDEAAQIMDVIVILAAACCFLKCLLVDLVHFKVLFFSHFFSPFIIWSLFV